MKIILVLLDGIGDRSHKVLEHRTPLQAAHTPNLDRLAQLGSNGLFHAGLTGQCLPSETAHYRLFGYDQTGFPGRGLLEAVGEGIPFADNDVLSLAHLSGVVWQGGIPVLTQGRRDIKGDPGTIEALYSAITPYETEGIGFNLNQTGPNDAILVMSGPVSPHISDADPMKIQMAVAEVAPMAGNPEPAKAERTARALNSYLSRCHKILADHDINRDRMDAGLPPANFLVTQRAGRRTVQEPFQDRWGLKGMVIASGSVYMGLAKELGLTPMRVIDGEDPGDDLRGRIRTALSDRSHDFIHVHTKTPDEAGHTKDPNRKRAVINSLDQGLKELVREAEQRNDLLVVVTADHSTPSSSALIHSGEPVPVCLVGPNIRRDDVTAFDEVSAGAGCMGLLRGQEIMLMILNCSDRSVLAGHCLGPVQRDYVPGAYRPFHVK
ncbi:MAG: 2,3-bisphosphoglycerate-independent phosphoglycerate mutase [Deltaproteobacteria bacterium]|nr:2,3-bisphosphoglycerate-independent phosphoglycerate mutase [Deltaproteobacteria bacterium]